MARWKTDVPGPVQPEHNVIMGENKPPRQVHRAHFPKAIIQCKHGMENFIHSKIQAACEDNASFYEY